MPNLNIPNDRDLYESQIATEEREKTTFTQDFLIAEAYGLSAIRDTYNRAVKGWKNSYKYFTELTMTLNHRLHMWLYRVGENDNRAKLYNNLWQNAYDWGCANLKGEELSFFYSVLDYPSSERYLYMTKDRDALITEARQKLTTGGNIFHNRDGKTDYEVLAYEEADAITAALKV